MFMTHKNKIRTVGNLNSSYNFDIGFLTIALYIISILDEYWLKSDTIQFKY